MSYLVLQTQASYLTNFRMIMTYVRGKTVVVMKLRQCAFRQVMKKRFLLHICMPSMIVMESSAVIYSFCGAVFTCKILPFELTYIPYVIIRSFQIYPKPNYLKFDQSL